MREIKFRGFVAGNINKMHYLSNKQLFEWVEDGVPIILMQFTGLHDKNGVEIYEGDILHYRAIDLCEESGFYDIYVKCVFQDCAFGWIGETTGRFISFCEQSLSDHEIVGNIYQNPELLK